MEIRRNGYRYKNYDCWGKKLRREYDYERYGLLKHMMSHNIVESKNRIVQFILSYVEDSLIFFAKYIDRLKHFKNIHKFNR